VKTGHPNRDIRPPSKCLWVRHVLRVVKGGKTVDVAICYQCHNYELHRDGGPHAGVDAVHRRGVENRC